jgi:hypothetical protein
VDLELPARLGVDQAQRTDGRQRQLARVQHLDDDHVVPLRREAQRPGPARWIGASARVDQVRDDDDQAAAPGAGGQGRQRRRQVRPRSVLAGHGQQQVQQRQAGVSAGARRDAARSGRGQHQRAEPVAGAAGQVGDGRGHGDRQVALLAPDRAERHRRGQVDDERRLELALGDGLAHVRLTGAGGRRPVDAAHVVARRVQPRLRGLQARTEQPPGVLALQQPVEPAPDVQVQPAHGRRRCERDRRHAASSSSARSGTTVGAWTASTTRRTTAPACTSSASAS